MRLTEDIKYFETHLATGTGKAIRAEAVVGSEKIVASCCIEARV